MHLIRELARRVPDDVPAGEDPAESALEDASETPSKKKKRRRLVVGAFGVGDLPLFQAALGIGGFDERFEAQVRAKKKNPLPVVFFSRLVDETPFRWFPFFSSSPNGALTPASRFPCATAVFPKAPDDRWIYLGHLRETRRSLPSLNIARM